MRGFRAVDTDLKCAVLIFLIATVGCWGCLTAFNITSGPEYAIGDVVDLALPVATGHGLVAMASMPPAIKDFLDKKTLVLDPRDYPKDSDLTTTPLWGEKFSADRYFLVYTIAFFWRIFGISWQTLNSLAALFFGLVAALVFGIFRLGMGRTVSIAGTVLTMISPVMLCEVLALRDFCKAPFILATIFLCGYLLARTVRRRRFLAVAGLLGIIIGIGVGFRQDSIICLPPALLFIVFFARCEPRLTVRMRLAGAALLVACFLVSAFPALRMTSRTGGNNSFYLMQGFALPCLRDLDMVRPSYVPLYSCADYIAYAYIDTFARDQTGYVQGIESLRTLATVGGMAEAQCTPMSPTLIIPLQGQAFQFTIWSRCEEIVARRYLYELAATFPADVIARWYAAALRVIRNLDPLFHPRPSDVRLSALQRIETPLSHHLYRYGLFYVVAAFLILSGSNFWLAVGVMFILLYFCGYPSLEFQVRHAFHLNFASFWFPGFVLDRVIAAARRVRGIERGFLFAAARRATLFAMLFAALTCIPLYTLRAFQQDRVGELQGRYARAELEPIPVVQQTDERGNTLYAPAFFPAFRTLPPVKLLDALALAGLPFRPAPDVLTEYVVAEFETDRRTSTAEIQYEDSEAGFDIADIHDTGPGVFRFFFPVFCFTENFYRPYWAPVSTFKGVSFQPGVNFKGFYRVRNREDFPFLMNVWLPSAPAQFKGYYGLKLLTE